MSTTPKPSPFNKTDPNGLVMTFRKIGGTWLLEWRKAGHDKGTHPLTRRKAHDTEIELIKQIVALQALLADPSAPRPVAELRLKPFKVEYTQHLAKDWVYGQPYTPYIYKKPTSDDEQTP